MSSRHLGVVSHGLGLMLLSATANDDVGNCSFKVVDPKTARHWTKWTEPVVLHKSFDWTPEFASREFISKALEHVSVRLVSKEFSNRSQIASGYASPDFSMKFDEWLRVTDDPDTQVPRYTFHWCRHHCARALSMLPSPPEFLATDLTTYFLTVGQPGPGIDPHAHGGSWVMQIAGSKEWQVVRPNRPFDPKKARACKQRPGDLVFVPEGWTHSTSQKSWSVSIGGQADSTDKVEDAGLFRQIVIGNATGLSGRLPSLSAEHKNKLAAQAGSYGHIDVLEALFEDPDVEMSDYLGATSVTSGMDHILSWLLGRAPTQSQRILDGARQAIGTAIQKNQQAVVKLLMESRADLKVRDAAESFMAGHQGMLELLLSERMKKPKEILEFIQLVSIEGRDLKNDYPVLHNDMMQTLKKSYKARKRMARNATKARKAKDDRLNV